MVELFEGENCLAELSAYEATLSLSDYRIIIESGNWVRREVKSFWIESVDSVQYIVRRFLTLFWFGVMGISIGPVVGWGFGHGYGFAVIGVGVGLVLTFIFYKEHKIRILSRGETSTLTLRAIDEEKVKIFIKQLAACRSAKPTAMIADKVGATDSR